MPVSYTHLYFGRQRESLASLTARLGKRTLARLGDLSGTKLQKLERAMRAAKMAGIASDVVGAWGLNPGAGR